MHRRFLPGPVAALGLGLALLGCAPPPPTHLDQVRASADAVELARACVLDVSEDIDRIKAKHRELSGWRPARPGVRSLTYDYKGCRVWLDIRKRGERQPGGAEPRERLAELGLNVYYSVEGRGPVKRAVEAAIRRHAGALAGIDRGRAEEKARTQPEGISK